MGKMGDLTPKTPGNVVKDEKKKDVGTPSVKLFFKRVEKINKNPQLGIEKSQLVEQSEYSLVGVKGCGGLVEKSNTDVEFEDYYSNIGSADHVFEQSYGSADSVACSRLSTTHNTAVQNQFEGGATVQNSCVSQNGAVQVKGSIWE